MTTEKPQSLFGDFHLSDEDRALTEAANRLENPSTDSKAEELREDARTLGLDDSGTKADLVERIAAHNREQEGLPPGGQTDVS